MRISRFIQKYGPAGKITISGDALMVSEYFYYYLCNTEITGSDFNSDRTGTRTSASALAAGQPAELFD
jgi:hypothetical protein